MLLIEEKRYSWVSPCVIYLILNLKSDQERKLVSNLVTADNPTDTLPQMEIPAWQK
jgi:hypothetical protein